MQTLTAHFGPKGPLNLSGPYTSEKFEAAVKVARETPLDSPDYAENLQAATRAGVWRHRRWSSPTASRTSS